MESKYTSYSEKDLFFLVAGGDEQAFAALFRRYYPILYKKALSYLKSEFWAEEIVQEVFVIVWKGKEQLVDIQNPAGWLHRLIWNKAIDRIRRRGAEVKAQYTLQQITEVATAALPADQREELLTALEKAVNQLSEQRKKVYLLRYKEDLGLEEIAGKLQLSRNSVRNYLAEATRQIRAYLLQHVDFYLVYCVCCYFL
ncbi:RNA polymerase sigma factor [Niabella drilacis]|uniref:RNA polymerase sigma-70 factor, ECF subfamily n=1 Tax=Niabella drilacis (strain DSM 25811 / CCM 8410 / CCUG 62505 / LMG 26954 / E90) TaxID=1285928 RepID=A0A1G6TBD8_NIADE|nr:sigma-70 family RNA polymerase sigma factor [Niabella drilacis]SDD26353.1 RNA polymerase sigma-70 factor, ECF subfamily [Niabella drilacis]